MSLYRTIVADPPWRYIQPAASNGAEPLYPTMTLGELVELPVQDADDRRLP